MSSALSFLQAWAVSTEIIKLAGVTSMVIPVLSGWQAKMCLAERGRDVGKRLNGEECRGVHRICVNITLPTLDWHNPLRLGYFISVVSSQQDQLWHNFCQNMQKLTEGQLKGIKKKKKKIILHNLSLLGNDANYCKLTCSESLASHLSKYIKFSMTKIIFSVLMCIFCYSTPHSRST